MPPSYITIHGDATLAAYDLARGQIVPRKIK
jgi:hypothetical protein